MCRDRRATAVFFPLKLYRLHRLICSLVVFRFSIRKV